MAIEIKMPQLSDTMNSGKILSWMKQEGEQVDRGDILAEVETDKANLEIESFYQGVLLKIITPAEQTAKVGEIIAYVGEKGEKISPPASSQSTPTAEMEESKNSAHTSIPAPVEESPQPKIVSPQPHADIASNHGTNGSSGVESSRVKASPLAKRIAADNALDLHAVRGTGPDGRIVRRDVEAALEQSQPPRRESRLPSASMPEAPQHPKSSGEGELHELSKMRETIARRMQQTVVEAPHFYTSCSIRMDQLQLFRSILKERPEYEGISYNHFIIKAAAYALLREPNVNRAFREPRHVFHPASSNIGIITAVEDGLIIPVLHQAEKLSLRDVIFESRALIERVRAGRPQSRDLSGGTFSISNLGMFDVEAFTALISPGQGAVLALGGILDQPVVEGGAVVPGKVMHATLSVDHRVIDGVMSARFLKYFREALECPALLTIE